MTREFSHITLNPFTALKTALGNIPQLKYALGVMGVAAVVSIVLTWIADPRIAVFGTIITLALMYVLAVFTQTVDSLPGLRWLAAFLTWSIAILFVVVLVLLLTSYTLGTPKTLSERLFPSTLRTEAAPVKPTPETASLSGTVVDTNDRPLQGAKVTLDNFPGMAPVETSSDGIFTIDQIPKRYGEPVRIRVFLPGYSLKPWVEDLVLGATPPKIVLRRGA